MNSNDLKMGLYKLDREDIKLAAILGRRGGNCRKVSLKKAGAVLQLTPSAISDRINKLLKNNFIEGFTADINLRMVYPELMSGMVAVNLKHRANRQEILRFAESCVYIQRCYDGRGCADHIFEITAPDWQTFNEVYHKIGALYSVDKVEILTTFSGGVEYHNQAELLPAV